MTSTTLSAIVPVKGPEYDKEHPETRQPWIDFRQGGFTATQMREWRKGGAKRREVLNEKVSGDSPDLSHLPMIRHGNLREPQIAAWVEERFGIAPTNAVYQHGANPRWMASPDGVALDPFTGALLVGGVDSTLSEIKTTNKDLTPGPLDPLTRTLIRVEAGSHFDRTGYYTQMQGQMLVMNAARTLFVWEQHDGVIDPETGTYAPVGPPEWCYVMRDEEFIASLISDTIEPALAEIDAARITHSLGELPPLSELPSETAALVADLLSARDAEAVAKKRKDKAWAALQEIYVGEGKPDVAIKIPGFANISMSNLPSSKTVVDEDGMREKARTTVERYEKLRARFTAVEVGTKQSFSVTASKS